MTTARKKWTTTFGSTWKAHASKKAVYAWIRHLTEGLAAGERYSSTVVSVYVDEQDGKGPRLYERVDLRDHAAAQTT